MNNWPEKVYLRTNPDAFDQGLPENNDFQGTIWTWLHDKEKAYSVEYTRSDLALPDDLKAELTAAIEKLRKVPFIEVPPRADTEVNEVVTMLDAAIERLNGVKS